MKTDVIEFSKFYIVRILLVEWRWYTHCELESINHSET